MGSITRAVHNIGLATWWGGTLMGTLAMNPAVEVLDDPEERGKMVDEGWARFQPYGAAGLGIALLSHIAMRLNGPEDASSCYRNTARLQDLLMIGAVASSAASMALGEYVTHQDFDTYNPIDSATEPSESTPEDVAEAQGGLTIASMVQLACGAGLFLTGAILAKKK